jgi:hypothetical protein
MPRLECLIERPTFTLTTWALPRQTAPAKVIQDRNTTRQKSRAAASRPESSLNCIENLRPARYPSHSLSLIVASSQQPEPRCSATKANEVLGACWRHECSLTSQLMADYSGSTPEIGRCYLPASGWRRPLLPCSPDSALGVLLSGRFVGVRHVAFIFDACKIDDGWSGAPPPHSLAP